VLFLGLVAVNAAAQPAGNWSTETRPPASASTAPAAATPALPVDPSAQVVVQVSAALTEDGQAIDQGLVWHVFLDNPDPAVKPRLVRQSREATPSFRLDPGEYLVNAAFGRANLTRRIVVTSGRPMNERFVLNAGGLKIIATLSGSESALDRAVSYDVFSEERDQTGNRMRIVAGAKPGRILRLNAGQYQVISTYGDANARVLTEVSIEPGKLTEATLTHAAARISFRLVTRPGGEALPEVGWSIQSAQGELIKESVGAVPTHVLAAGKYVVVARRQGRAYRAEFTANAGDNTAVEVVAR